MTTHHGPHERDGEVPRWAATAGRRGRARRWVVRLGLSPRRRPAANTARPDVTASDVPWPLRQRVLRDDHAATRAEARRMSEQMVRAGFNTGTVPYGYRAQRIQVTPAGKRPRWRTRLVIEPVEATTVKMIFTWRGEDGLTITAIRQRLLSARYPAPLHPQTGQPGEWTHAFITATLRNPKYLGRQVWGRRHHDRRTPHQTWVWSPQWAHPPIVSAAEFVAANRHTRLATALPVTDEDPVAGSSDRRVS